MPVDLKELRRLHEEYVKAKSALKPKSSAGHLTYDMAKNALVVASLDTMPELLDRLEAAEKLPVIICHNCGATVMYKRLDSSVEIFHNCTSKAVRDRIEVLEAEVARLREALREISEGWGLMEAEWASVGIAREALEGR